MKVLPNGKDMKIFKDFTAAYINIGGSLYSLREDSVKMDPVEIERRAWAGFFWLSIKTNDGLK